MVYYGYYHKRRKKRGATMSIVSLLTTCGEEEQQPRQAGLLLRKLLLPFGGGELYFAAEKPLFLLDLSLPADKKTGVNFDPRLAWAVLDMARNHGATQVSFAVRTEEGFSFDQVLAASGYDQLARLEGVNFIDLRQAPTLDRSSDLGLALDRLPIYAPVAQAGLVVSLAKFKAAQGSLFGGAFHNLALTTPALAELSGEQRARALVDIYSIMAPDLTIIDGWRGDAGFQSHQGDFVLAAVDAVAADAVLAALAGLDLNSLENIQLAAQYGLGEGDPGDVHLDGDDISERMAN